MAFLAKTSASRDVMAREKRPLDQRDGMPEEKRQRPALASVIVEAVKMDSLQKLCSTLEPLLRRVVHFCSPAAFANFLSNLKEKLVLSPLSLLTISTNLMHRSSHFIKWVVIWLTVTRVFD
jgi:hypothetical protein